MPVPLLHGAVTREIDHDHVVGGQVGVRRPVPQLLPDLFGAVVLPEAGQLRLVAEAAEQLRHRTDVVRHGPQLFILGEVAVSAAPQPDEESPAHPTTP